ncbi:DUF1499 domain-containing protein [Marinobacterium nitratireducens]|nr:DUF1499 domain-containing protein [Marinobacterium nitratireducens]
MKQSILLVLVLLQGCSGQVPDGLGLHDGQLAPCPQSPNCVGSEYPQHDSHIEALRFDDTPADAWRRLQRTVREDGGRIEQQTETYLWATWRSRLFRFVDDVEFRLEPEQKRIEVRSASRLGHWDLGVNRDRVERLRDAFQRP